MSAALQPALSIIKTTTYSWLYSDKGSGTYMDISLYRPTTTDPNYMIIGDYAQSNYSNPIGTSFMVKASDDDPNNPVIKPPLDYQQVWNDKGSAELTMDQSGSHLPRTATLLLVSWARRDTTNRPQSLTHVYG